MHKQLTNQARALANSPQAQAVLKTADAAAGVVWRTNKTLAPIVARANPVASLAVPLAGAIARTPAGKQLSHQVNKTPLAQAVQKLDQRYSGTPTPLTPQLTRLPQQSHGGPNGAAARQLVAAERSLLTERTRYITEVARGEKNIVQRGMDHLRERWTYVTTGQRGVLDDAVKNYDVSLQRIRATGQRFQAGRLTAPAVQTQVQQTGQTFIKEHARVQAVQAKQLEWGMAAANVTRDVGAVVAATGVTISTGGNVALGVAAGYGVKELGDLAIEGVGSTGGRQQRQMTADRSWVYHLATQAPSGQWGGWEATGKALRREGGDLAWSTVDALGANYIAKATTTLALRWAPQIFKNGAAANPALKLQFFARGGLTSRGVYQQALPGLLMQQKVSTVLASATAATTWQSRRGIGEIGATAAQVAEQGQLFTAQGRKTVGDKAFEQLVALPFASLSSGAAALLPNVGRFAIPSQALSDTGFGVAEGQITTLQREGRWMNHLELFTRSYASGLGSVNNLILHPNNLLRARANASQHPHSAKPVYVVLAADDEATGSVTFKRGSLPLSTPPGMRVPIASSLASIIANRGTVSQPYANSAFQIQPPINRLPRTDEAPRFTSPLGDPPAVKNIVARQLKQNELILPRRPSTELNSFRVGVQARVGFGAYGFDTVAFAGRVFLTTNNDLPIVAVPPNFNRYSGPLVEPAKWLSKVVPASLGWRVNAVPAPALGVPQFGVDSGPSIFIALDRNLESGAIETHPDGGYRLKKVGQDAGMDEVTLAAPLELTLLRQMSLGTKGLRWMNFFPILPNAGYSSIESKKAKVSTLPKHIADMMEHALRNNSPEFTYTPQRFVLQPQLRIKIAPPVSIALPLTATRPRPSHWDEFSNRVWEDDQTSGPRRSESLQAGVRGGLLGLLHWQLLVYAQRFKLQPTYNFSVLQEPPNGLSAKLLSNQRDAPNPVDPADDSLSVTGQTLTNIETAWQQEVRSFLKVANAAQVNAALTKLNYHNLPKVAEWLTQENAQHSATSAGNSTAGVDLVEVLIDKLLHAIPDELAQAINNQGLPPEQVREFAGKLVMEREVAALVGYRLLEALESNDESWRGGSPPRESLPQATLAPQQGRQRGALATGPDVAARLDRFIGSFPPDGSNSKYEPAPHLRITSHGTGSRSSFHILPERLKHESRQAYDRLKKVLGGTQRLNDMARALVVGYVSKTGQELVGLRALAEAWRDAAATDPSLPPLDGSMLVEFGKAVFNQPNFGSMEDLQALVAVHIPKAGFRGLLHPTADINYVSPWVAPANDNLQQFQGLTTSSPPSLEEQIQQSPWYLDYLRRAQTTYDDSQVGDVWEQSPWHDSNDPGFKNTLAAREAFWLALWNAGLKDKAPNLLQSLEVQHWVELVGIAPELEHMNFAGSFIEQHDNMMQVLPQALVPYERPIGALQVQAEALRLIENTFAGDELREKLRYYLLVFEHPGALRLYGNSPEFQRDAAKLAVEQFAPVGLLPWVQTQLIERASQLAKTETFQQQVGVEDGNWLQALEILATTDEEKLVQVRSDLVDQIVLLQAGQTRLLENLGESLRGAGIAIAAPPSLRGAPTNGATAQLIPSLRAETLDDAVLELLGRAGIKATLAPVVDGPPRQLLVEPLAGFDVIPGMPLAQATVNGFVSSAGGRSPSDVGQSISPAAVYAAMDEVTGALKRAGYPTEWQLRNTHATSASTNSNQVNQDQQQQQPQQAPASDADSDPNGPRTLRQRFLDRLPVVNRHHLGWQTDNSVKVIEDQLSFTPRAAFDALVAELGGKNSGLGEYRLNLMLNALIMGYEGEIGLRALAKAWLAQAGDSTPPQWSTLTGTNLSRLAQIAFNDDFSDAKAGTLGAMASLIGIDSPSYRGILHPSVDAETRRSEGGLSEEMRGQREEFWRVLSNNGLPGFILAELEAELNKLNPPSDSELNPNGLWLGPTPKKDKDPPGQSLDWAHVVSQYPWLANLDFAKIFGGQDTQKKQLQQIERAASTPKHPRLTPAEDAAKRSAARNIAESTFKDPGLRDRLRLYLINTLRDEAVVNAFADSNDFLPAAMGIVVEMLIDKREFDQPKLDHPKHVSELRTFLEKAAQARLAKLPEGSTILNGLEHVLLSPDTDDTLQRSLLRRRMNLQRLELSKNLLAELAEVLSELGIERTYGRVAQSDTFPDALRVALGQFHIDARLERSTDDRTRTIVVTPWSWNSPTLDPALNEPLIKAMNYVVDRLTQAGYPTQWKWADPPDPL